MGTRWILLVMAIIVTAPALPMAAAPSPTPPYAPGTTWTYRHSVTKTGEAPRIGTSRDVYRGQVIYRGQAYYMVEISSSLLAGFVERIYLVWTGSYFRQASNVATDAQNNTLELILDRPFGLGVQENVSGTAQVIQNRTQSAEVPWSYTATSRGRGKLTVPAGTFQAARWDGVFRIGRLEKFLTIHTVGIRDIRRDSQEYVGGTRAATISRELINGPIR